MSQPTPPGTRAHWTFISVALLILGLLILIPSGLCTALVGGSIVAEGVPNGDFSGIAIVLLYGGPPIAVGAALVWAAFKARRRD